MAERGAQNGMESTVEIKDESRTGEVSEKETKSSTDDHCNDDLNDLLDDALEDFDKLSSCAAGQPVSSSSDPLPSLDAAASSSASATESSTQQSQDALFEKIFSQSDPASLENFFSSFMSSDTSKLEEQFQSFDTASGSAPGNITETLQQTIGSLLQNTQQLQQEDNITQEEILQMMSSMGLDGELPSEGDFFPMMQGMMKDLLSKDVLYPSLKEITAQYPKWLTDNKGKVDEEQYNKYEEQHRLMSQITKEFEEEGASDTDDVKRKRFERILDLMQKMQELGHPPKEIVGDVPNGLEMDEDGLPKLPSAMFPNPDQCHIM